MIKKIDDGEQKKAFSFKGCTFNDKYYRLLTIDYWKNCQMNT